MNAKKIAEKLREIASFYGRWQIVHYFALSDALTDIANELDPPEPKPLLADAKAGDLCMLRNGGYTQIDSVKRLGGKTWYDRTDRYTSYPDGRLFKGENNESDIIATEPLAEVDSAEWAWQMLMLQKPVSHPAEGEFQDTYYTKAEFVRCMAKTGWQLYEPVTKAGVPFEVAKDVNERITECLTELGCIEPEPATEPKPRPQYKVGDWVEYKGNQYRISAFGGEGMMFLENAIFALTPPYPVRKLDPSEVRVRIGCLEGTIERHDGNPQYWFKLRSSEYNYALISIDMLDTPTRELVESLLRAQEVNNG